ncbi:MAG: MBL fold metallo-hydrolase [Candidatus Methanoliparum thermophilum]|uniref:MBL fold metallo-hydrolase n=1 Tax=Methanoliparum thermophilum TaxID=2491083 RepID=A0A520KR71_METT2|nr:MAG: MBL fold metallo-hydrolase [Candidatus Methanoliparum thermophilum]
MTILTIVYDDRTNYYGGNIKADRGLSYFINGENLLFDAGRDGRILLDNMEALGVDVKSIKKIVISHDHEEHIGGLFDILELNSDIDVYGLSSFSPDILKKIKKMANLIIVEEPTYISEKIFSTGPLGKSIKEQSLAIKTGEGFLVLTGCAHSSIAQIFKIVSKKGNIFGIIGGVHSLDETDIFMLKNLPFLAFMHCTPIEEIEKISSNIKKIGVGNVIFL